MNRLCNVYARDGRLLITTTPEGVDLRHFGRVYPDWATIITMEKDAGGSEIPREWENLVSIQHRGQRVRVYR